MKFLLLFSLFSIISSGVYSAPPQDGIHISVPGGYHQLDTKDESLIEVLANVQPLLNQKMNSIYYYKIGQVISAETQVVAGVNYHVKFEFGATNCRKDSKLLKDASHLAVCKGFESVQICDALIRSKPWNGQMIEAIEHFECQPLNLQQPQQQNSKLDGGIQPINVDDAELVQALKNAESQLNKQHMTLSNTNKQFNNYYYRVGKILQAESQIVSGVLYYVKFEFEQTMCKVEHIQQANNSNKCGDIIDHVEICDAQILSQEWVHNLVLSSMRCQLKPVENN